jgi:hypothetical protein
MMRKLLKMLPMSLIKCKTGYQGIKHQELLRFTLNLFVVRADASMIYELAFTYEYTGRC